MRKVLVLAALMLCQSTLLVAQDEHLKFSTRYDVDNNAVIEAHVIEPGQYTVVLDFYRLENISTERLQRVTVLSSGPVFVLKPKDATKESDYGFRYRYIWGGVNPRNVDREFVYLLPFDTTLGRQMFDMYDLYARHGMESNMVDLRAFQFEMERGDVVRAARKGTVIRVVDRFDPVTDLGEITMNTENNQVWIEHADGTIAKYGVLERGSVEVKSGDVVFPGTPIAKVGTFDGEKYQLRFSVIYQTDNFLHISESSEWKVAHNYIDPIFATSVGEVRLTNAESYLYVANDELICREMNKRELKRFQR